MDGIIGYFPHRVMQLGEKVDQLSAIKKDVEYLDPSPSSEECKV
jgi:hypothetical protein